MAQQPPAWEPPHEIDGYRLVRPIGAGAMGRVYLAHDTTLDREIALKFIAADRPDLHATRRFLIEARAIARLTHPNVVSIYRIGEIDGRPYIAYEFVRGASLEHSKRPLPWREVLKIGLGLLRGLAAAHGRGILHRDIKPANIMLSESGDVKLVDFGIAKVIGAEPTDPYRTVSGRPPRIDLEGDLITAPAETPLPDQRGITEAGVVIGTPRYLAPERWSGHPATPCSEVFSVGLVLYELCTDTTIERSSHGKRTEPYPPLESVARDVPAEIATVIDRSVKLDPEARFKTPEEACEALESAGERAKNSELEGRAGDTLDLERNRSARPSPAIKSSERRVRVSVAPGFSKLLAAHLGRLRREEPDLLVQVLTANVLVDLASGEAELALRIGPFTSDGLLITRVGDVGWALYASESYLANHSIVSSSDLGGHDIIGFSDHLSHTAGAKWFAEHATGARIVLECNALLDVVDAAQAGLGLAILPCVMAERLVRVGTDILVRRELMLVQTHETKDDPDIARVATFLTTVLEESAALLLGRNE